MVRSPLLRLTPRTPVAAGARLAGCIECERPSSGRLPTATPAGWPLWPRMALLAPPGSDRALPATRRLEPPPAAARAEEAPLLLRPNMLVGCLRGSGASL